MGVLTEASRTALSFEGPVAFAWDGLIPREHRELERPRDQLVVIGPLAGGTPVDRLDAAMLEQRRVRGTDRHRFEFSSGAVVEGRVERAVRDRHGRLLNVELANARVALGDRPAFERARYQLFAVGEPVTAHAGAVDPAYHGESAFSGLRVPKARAVPEGERALLELYEQAARAHARGHSTIVREFPRVHDALVERFPDEWLLRWNLLESLLKVRGGGGLATALRGELERLEVAFDYRQPIASGLRYLEKLAA
jgi:hypothetical protein